MYLPKWIVALLFGTSIVSLSTLLIVFLRNSAPVSTASQPSATIVVATSPEATAAESAAAQPEQITAETAAAPLASEEWKTHTQKEIDLSVEIPKNWSGLFDRNALVLSDPASLEKSVTISRERKSSSRLGIEDLKKSRAAALAKDTNVKMSGSPVDLTVHEYKAVGFTYSLKDVATREVVFVTRNYVYTIVMLPDSSETKMVMDEVLKGVKII